MSAIGKVRRLLQLLERLQSGRTHTTEELSHFCGISRRTVFRDIKTLQQAGIPILYDSARQGYWITASSTLPPTNLTLQETLALLLLANAAGDGDRSIPFQKSARDAALKLQSNLPMHLAPYANELLDGIRIHTEPQAELATSETHYQRILEAYTQRKKVRLTYRSFAEQKTIITLLSPYRLLFRRHSWYVIGRSSIHRSVRTFHIGRVEESELTQDGYEIPPRFSLKSYFKLAWNMICEPGARTKVVVRFQPMVAQNVAEICWHPTQQIEWNPDGTLNFSVTVDGIHEISWWILSYGDQAQVLEPEPLVELVASRARKMVAQYDEAPNASPAPARKKRSRK
jgi:Predicted transcriptional regulator